MKYLLLLLSLIVFPQTPISAESKPFPYQYQPQLDGALLFSGVSLSTIYFYYKGEQPLLNASDLKTMKSKDINSFDQAASQNWSESAAHLSDITKDSVIYPSLLLSIPLMMDGKWKELGILSTMIVESYLLVQGITGVTKITMDRPRPYLFNDSLSHEKKTELAKEHSATRSFFSGHTSGAFAGAITMAKLIEDIYGPASWTPYVWGGTLTLATLTGFLRFQAGVHYPSDILVGGLIGSAIGYFVPWIHHKDQANIKFTLLSPSEFGIKILF